jgi:acetylornithine deacetylase/succinyl-diaminopimelate desuccinylase-like protein
VRRRLGRLWEARGYDTAPVIYGRGSFDNKGPVAVAWLATVALARALDATGSRLGGTLVTGFVVDEEDAMAGVSAFAGGPGCWLDRHGLLPSDIGSDGMRSGIKGVALDGSYGFVPVVGHRGIAQLVVRTSGQAAHAATPALGENAVTRMAAALHALASEPAAVDAALAPLFSDGLLEPATLAIGTTIAGGGIRSVTTGSAGRTIDRGGINVVPDWCEATIDCRHPRPADGDVTTIRERIAETVRAFMLDRTGLPANALTVEVLGGGPPCAILARPEDGIDDDLVGPVLRHGAEISGFQPWVETAPGGTDATVMINRGRIRSIVEFGPAGAFAHEPHEFVERDQIAVGAEILARTIADALGIIPG